MVNILPPKGNPDRAISWRLNLSAIYALINKYLIGFYNSEIKKYFQNTYDLYETLFKALKGESVKVETDVIIS